MSTATPTVRAPNASPPEASATVIPLGVRPRSRMPRPPALGWAAIAVAVVLAASPLADGYFDFSWWGALALGAMVLLVVLAGAARPAFTREGVAAFAGLGLLLALSAASMPWAESQDSAWTEVNRLALYGPLRGRASPADRLEPGRRELSLRRYSARPRRSRPSPRASSASTPSAGWGPGTTTPATTSSDATPST